MGKQVEMVLPIVSFEDDYIKRFEKHDFYESLIMFGVDIERVFPTKSSTEKCYRESFNFALKKISEVFRTPIIECVLHLYEDYADIRSILFMLDNDVMFMLKEELAQKHDIKLPKNLLAYFMYD